MPVTVTCFKVFFIRGMMTGGFGTSLQRELGQLLAGSLEWRTKAATSATRPRPVWPSLGNVVGHEPGLSHLPQGALI